MVLVDCRFAADCADPALDSPGNRARQPSRPRSGRAARVLAVYFIRSQILALPRPDCQKTTADRVNGQHTPAVAARIVVLSIVIP